jgi:hypothetical protein
MSKRLVAFRGIVPIRFSRPTSARLRGIALHFSPRSYPSVNLGQSRMPLAADLFSLFDLFPSLTANRRPGLCIISRPRCNGHLASLCFDGDRGSVRGEDDEGRRRLLWKARRNIL